MSDLDTIKLISYSLYFLLTGFLEFDWKFRLFYGFISGLIELFAYQIVIKITNLIGEWTYYLGTAILYIVIVYMLVYRVRKYRDNPYLLSLKHHSKEYLMQLAIFSLNDFDHPSIEYFEPLIVDKQGSISRYEKTEVLMNKILDIQKEISDKKQVQMVITRIKNSSKIYPRFQIYLYSIYDDSGDFSNTFAVFNNLVLKYDMVERIKLGKIAKSKLRNCIYYNTDSNQVLIDPKKLTKLTSNFSFEIGRYEFYVFKELIEESNEDVDPISILKGKYFIGEDIYRYPVHVDKPRSTVYLGREEHMLQIMEFEYYKNSILFTDDPNLIEIVSEKHKDVLIYDIGDLFLDLIYLNSDEPKFFKKLLTLYEELLPDSIKSGYKSTQVAGKIIEFLELKQLYDPEFYIIASDLLNAKTYHEFSTDLSIDISSKFKEILTLALFNKKNNSLLEILNTPGRKIISLDGLGDKAKFAIIILLLVLKDQFMSRNPFLISIIDQNLELETHLNRLVKELDFDDTIIHMRGVVNNFSWLNYFDLYLCDAGFDNDKIKKILFRGLHEVNKGIYLNHEFREKTILEVIE